MVGNFMHINAVHSESYPIYIPSVFFIRCFSFTTQINKIVLLKTLDYNKKVIKNY